jgi:hypothetical protein
MPDDVPLSVRFPPGCRVRFSALAREKFALRRDVTSTVVGYLPAENCVRIVRDGNRNRSRESWHATYLERAEESEHA